MCSNHAFIGGWLSGIQSLFFIYQSETYVLYFRVADQGIVLRYLIIKMRAKAPFVLFGIRPFAQPLMTTTPPLYLSSSSGESFGEGTSAYRPSHARSQFQWGTLPSIADEADSGIASSHYKPKRCVFL